MTHILFHTVTDNNSKLSRIAHIVQEHFYKKDKILIFVPSDEAATFLDQLLWRLPEGSFLPHAIVKGPSNERIAVTTVSENVNHANVLINLVQAVPAHAQQFERIHELMDLTHPAKKELSEKRLEEYTALKLSVKTL